MTLSRPTLNEHFEKADGRRPRMYKLNSRDVLLGWGVPILINVFLLTHPSGLAKVIANGATHGTFAFEREQGRPSNQLFARRSVPSTHNSGMVGDISSGSGGSGDKPVQPRNQPPQKPSTSNGANYMEVSPDFMRTPQFLNK
jgi:hypothetical protein